MSRSIVLLTSLLLLGSSACTFVARDAEGYRNDTRALLETRSAEIKECYDVILQTSESVAGDVVVNFTVEKKTGKVMNPAIDTAKTTAPAEIGKCIVDAIDGLQLDPADQREGQASFSWTFKVGSPKAS
jgi:hypothetical protein